MALSCDLKDIAQAAAGCEEQLSGLGNMVYVAYPEDLQAAPTYEENSAAFASTSFKFTEGKGAWKIRCKKQSVQLTATGNEGPKGFNVQLVFVPYPEKPWRRHFLCGKPVFSWNLPCGVRPCGRYGDQRQLR